MSGVYVSLQNQRLANLTDPYLLLNIALVVPDHRREQFSTLEGVRRDKGLRVAALTNPIFVQAARKLLPQAEIIEQSSPRPFLRGQLPDVDAFLMTAEAGSAWTIVYPAYSVTVPDNERISVPVAYAVGKHDADWLTFLNTWIELRTHDGTVDDLFAHWFQGGMGETKEPRWSVIRNVLGWVD